MIDGMTGMNDPVGATDAVVPTLSAGSDPLHTGVSSAAASASSAPSIEELPCYTKSLLHIRVPVVVTLARKRQPLERIVELGPGSIIHFAKSCDQMLELEVGEQPIAEGEAVKVGDKFGLRITSIILPEERFQPVRKTAKG